LVGELVAQCACPEAFLGIFASHGWTAEQLSRANPSNQGSRPYSRLVLASSPECEVMVARWSADRECAPHDLGRSGGWVFFFEADFEETSYHWVNEELRQGERRGIPAGSFVSVVQDEIHSCRSLGSGLSLHVYFPAIQGMRVFDQTGRRTLRVGDDSGAWIPESEQIVEQVLWPS
jgi:hypothetical protein